MIILLGYKFWPNRRNTKERKFKSLNSYHLGYMVCCWEVKIGNKCSLFLFIDDVDKLLMFLGILGSIGEGMSSPLTMYVMSGAIDTFEQSDQSITNEVVDKVWIACLSVTCIFRHSYITLDLIFYIRFVLHNLLRRKMSHFWGNS